MSCNDCCDKILSIKTDMYAGNFERELCAYATGIYGDCEVGKEHADSFKNIYGDIFENIVDPFVIDEHGCGRPVSIGKHNDEVYIYFYEKPSNDLLKILKLRAEEFCIKNNIKISGYAWITRNIKIEEVDIT